LGVALEILLRIDERRLIRDNLLAVLFDHESLLGNLLVERVDAGPRRRHVGAGLVERGPVILRLDARQHLAGRDRLVVVDRHLGNVARHFGADQDRMRLNIGIIGRDQEPAGRPVVAAVNRRHRHEQQRSARDQQVLQGPTGAPGLGRGSLDGPRIVNDC
jgi:hypothetical protein